MDQMLTKAEYETLVSDFIVEINHLWVHEADEPLRALPSYEKISNEYLPDLRDADQDGVQVLRTAFAYVDEFVHADWARVIGAGYAAHVARHRLRTSEEQSA
jgi:hypothetical protein